MAVLSLGLLGGRLLGLLAAALLAYALAERLARLHAHHVPIDHTLLALLTKFAWKPIMQGLENREEGIARQIAETQAANAEAKRMLASYERRLAEASEEVRGMLEEARRDAEATKQAIVAEARKASEDERTRAKHEIQLAKNDALAQIAEKAGHLAVEVAGKFLRDKLGADDQARLVRESVASLSSRPSVN